MHLFKLGFVPDMRNYVNCVYEMHGYQDKKNMNLSIMHAFTHLKMALFKINGYSFKGLLLYCCFTSTVNIYGHVGMVI